MLLLLACNKPTPQPADTGIYCDSALTEAQVSEASAAPHPEFGSLLVVRWQQGRAGTAWVEFHLEGEGWQSSPAEIVNAGEQQALILGMPYGESVTWRVANDFCAGPLTSAEQQTDTDPLPDWVPTPVAVTGDSDRWDPESRFFLTSMYQRDDSDRYLTYLFDRQGRVVWAREHPRYTSTLHPRVSRDGAWLLLDSNTWWTLFDASFSEVHQLKIDGSGFAAWPTPGLHHAFTDTADGALIWGAFEGVDELLMERQSPTDPAREIWSCQEQLTALVLPGQCASNTVAWSEDDHILFSFYTLETVFEIDRESGDALRWFGHLQGSWAFSPSDGAFWWQHGGHYLPDGHLLISSHLSDRGEETVVREYQLDEASETLIEVWRFGEGLGVHGEEMGEPHRLGNGNTLHNYGTTPRLREATPEGEVVWDVRWDQWFIGRSTPLSDLYLLAP